jgi:DmsE family decaheme c-type cytochrome
MRRALFMLTLAATVAVLGMPSPARAQAPPATWSVTDCQTCHDKAVSTDFTRSKHGGLEQSCAQCHPNVADHFKAQSAGDANGPVPTLKKFTAKELNAVCMACHEKANQTSWLSGMHARMNVACTDCHGIHAYKSVNAQLKTERDPETCATCHKAQRALMLRTSHHPVREGKLACSSCHNPHEGNVPNMLKADSVNDLCYQCHAEKRGPFAFEHAPVREDCASCHNPHGSNHARLLIQKMPNLCWNCHFTGSGHFGSGDNLSTEEGVPVAPTGAASGYPTVNSRFIERSCRSCHVKVHGSNHPSGAFFVR